MYQESGTNPLLQGLRKLQSKFCLETNSPQGSVDPMDYSLPGFSIHGIFQARVLEWVAISFFRGSSRPRDQTWVSLIVGRCYTVWATREVHVKVKAESEKVGLKVNIQKTKFMASGPIMGNRWGNSGNSGWLFFLAPKSLQMVTAAMKLKDAYSLEGKLWPT